MRGRASLWDTVTQVVNQVVTQVVTLVRLRGDRRDQQGQQAQQGQRVTWVMKGWRCRGGREDKGGR